MTTMLSGTYETRKLCEIGEGTSEILRVIIARGLGEGLDST